MCVVHVYVVATVVAFVESALLIVVAFVEIQEVASIGGVHERLIVVVRGELERSEILEP